MMVIYIEVAVTLWAACMLYLIFIKHRPDFRLRLLLASACFLAVVMAAGLLTVTVPEIKIPVIMLMTGYFLICFLFIYFCADMPAGAAVYCAAWSMITQQVAYEFAYILRANVYQGNMALVAGYTIVVYVAVYIMAGMTIARYMPEDGIYQVGPRQLTSALFLLVVFEILFEFLRTEKMVSITSTRAWNILLVQCYCVIILYLQNTLFKKSAMKQELDTLNQLWHQQKDQYELSRETIALINHKCHDLKHQISAMRAITSPEEREKYLREVEDSVQIYDSIVKTGNEVLDVVLTEKSLSCAANNIKINCIADGRRMDILDPVDLYTIFGNAIDNAMESVKQLENQEMRMIDVLVYVRQQFLMINIMNPVGVHLEFDGELPVSTKTKNGYHGFGLKSIRYLMQKYNGFMKIDVEENIFSLKMLIPLSKDET